MLHKTPSSLLDRQASMSFSSGKSLFLKALLGLLAALTVSSALYHCVFYDLAVVTWYPATRENTAGKRILITGSSRGIGKALAQLYSELGAHVTVHSRDAAALEQVASSCRGLGAASAHAVPGDMSQPGAAAAAVRAAADAMGGALDLVVLNHADSGPFETLARSVEAVTASPDRLNRAMRTNLLSYAEASLAALPYLEWSNGSLLLVSSVITRFPMPYCFDYCFSKRSLEGFVIALRQELAMNDSRVHVGLAVPGPVDTLLARRIMANSQGHSESTAYASPLTVARDIAAMPVARNRELLTPWTMRLPAVISAWAPEMIEKELRWRVD